MDLSTLGTTVGTVERSAKAGLSHVVRDPAFAFFRKLMLENAAYCSFAACDTPT